MREKVQERINQWETTYQKETGEITDAINNSLHSRMNRDSAFGYSGWGQRQRRSEWVLQMTQATIASPRQMAYPSRTANANI